MIFYENCLLADDSHEIPYLKFRKFGKMLQNMFVSPDPTYIPTKMHSTQIIYYHNMLSFFLAWVAKANPIQTDVKVVSHVFPGDRGEENCATIYQMNP